MRIETERLLLRVPSLDELEEYVELAGDPLAMRFSVGGPESRDEVEDKLPQVIERVTQRGYGLLSVMRKEDDAFLGWCMVKDIELDGEKEWEIGYRFLPRYWGNGYATEAALGYRDFAFKELGVGRLIAVIESENAASIAVAKRLGMRMERESVYCGLEVEVYFGERSAIGG
ncbi:MAG: GNAT family N-acetyltransferase [Verrucomicrobiota bacterium]